MNSGGASGATRVGSGRAGTATCGPGRGEATCGALGAGAGLRQPPPAVGRAGRARDSMRLVLCALPALLGDALPRRSPVRLVGSVRLSLLAKGRCRRYLGRAVASRVRRDGDDEARNRRCHGDEVGDPPDRPRATEATAAARRWSGGAIGDLVGAVAGRGVVEDPSRLAHGRIGLILKRAGLREDVDARGLDGERASVGDCGSGCHRPTEGRPANLAPKNFSRRPTPAAAWLTAAVLAGADRSQGARASGDDATRPPRRSGPPQRRPSHDAAARACAGQWRRR